MVAKDKPTTQEELKSDGASMVGVELIPPTSAITADGEWLVVSLSKFWLSRNGRKGVVDPSGGLTFEPPYNTVILIALPLVDKPTTPQPESTLTMEQIETRVLKPLVTMNDALMGVKTSDF